MEVIFNNLLNKYKQSTVKVDNTHTHVHILDTTVIFENTFGLDVGYYEHKQAAKYANELTKIGINPYPTKLNTSVGETTTLFKKDVVALTKLKKYLDSESLNLRNAHSFAFDGYIYSCEAHILNKQKCNVLDGYVSNTLVGVVNWLMNQTKDTTVTLGRNKNNDLVGFGKDYMVISLSSLFPTYPIETLNNLFSTEKTISVNTKINFSFDDYKKKLKEVKSKYIETVFDVKLKKMFVNEYGSYDRLFELDIEVEHTNDIPKFNGVIIPISKSYAYYYSVKSQYLETGTIYLSDSNSSPIYCVK